jgi:hypothetical protein
MLELVKIIVKYLYVKKNANDLSKCSEKHALHVYAKFMHCLSTLIPAEIEELIGTPYGKLGFAGLLL